MNRCHGLLGPQNGSDLPSALGLVDNGAVLYYVWCKMCDYVSLLPGVDH